MERLIKGLHHITLVTRNYRVNSDFYVDVLSLRRVKLSVNQDDIYHRHAFYANPERTTGSAVTFFEWPHLPQGFPGLGAPHHLAYRTRSVETLAKWYGWLSGKGVRVKGPFKRGESYSIYFRDPDGSLIEVLTSAEDIEVEYVKELIRGIESVEHVDEEMKLVSLDHASPIASDHDLIALFAEKFLGLKKLDVVENPDDPNSVFLLLGGEDGEVYLRYLINPSADYGLVGIGSIHHIALAVENEEDQRKLISRFRAASISNSGVIDRFWFKSVYFRDPEGNLLEVATEGPGYDVDEPRESLGNRLVLPPWLEQLRASIEAKLAELDANNTSTSQEYPETPERPELYEPVKA